MESMIYTKFTDAADTVKEIFDNHAGRSGRVITTMSAGWPLFFLVNGASYCTVIERNEPQVDYILDKYSGSSPEHTTIRQMLLDSTDIQVCDFMDLPPTFWKGRVYGDEVVFLSNIWDHAESEGRALEYVLQILSILRSSDRRVSITLVSSSFSQPGLDRLEDMLSQHISQHFPFISTSYTSSGRGNGALKDFRVFEFQKA